MTAASLALPAGQAAAKVAVDHILHHGQVITAYRAFTLTTGVALLRAGSHSAAYNSAALRIAKVDTTFLGGKLVFQRGERDK